MFFKNTYLFSYYVPGIYLTIEHTAVKSWLISYEKLNEKYIFLGIIKTYFLFAYSFISICPINLYMGPL